MESCCTVFINVYLWRDFLGEFGLIWSERMYKRDFYQRVKLWLWVFGSLFLVWNGYMLLPLQAVVPESGSTNGLWGIPTTTFTLPGPGGDGGLYVPDIQASYPGVDWANLDRLYIPAGHYKFIRIGNLPDRSPSDPLIISNTGGQVRVGALGHYYLFILGGGSGWILTGRYDPVSQTGHVDYQGHADERYADSAGQYGIYINDEYTREIAGLAVGGGATQYELEFIEIARTGFTGISLKTDNDGDALMEDVHVHDLYIHDTGGEGMYIGSTQAQPQHKFRDLHIYNNRVLRTALETIQIGQMGDGVEVHHNIFGPGAIGWRSAFQQYQDKNLQIYYREGVVDIHHNVFIGATDSLIYLRGSDLVGDNHAAGDGVHIHNNYFAHTGWLGGYIFTETPQAAHRIENNYFRGYRFIRDEVYDWVVEATHFFRLNQSGGDLPILFNNNQFELPNHLKFVSVLSDSDGNSTTGNVSGSGNVRGSVTAIAFVDFGVPADFDYSRIEYWTETATVVPSDPPVSYVEDDIVIYAGISYRCQVVTCTSGLVPPDNPSAWLALPPFPDDVRLVAGSPYEGIGLLPIKPSLTIEVVGTTAHLSWLTVSNTCAYDLYASATPYSGFTLLAGDLTGTTYDHVGAIGSVTYYELVAKACDVTATVASEARGLFTFAITAGT